MEQKQLGQPTYEIQIRPPGNAKFKTILATRQNVIKDYPKLLEEFTDLDSPLGENERNIILRWLKRGRVTRLSEGTQVSIVQRTPRKFMIEKVFPPPGYVLEWRNGRFIKRLAKGR